MNSVFSFFPKCKRISIHFLHFFFFYRILLLFCFWKNIVFSFYSVILCVPRGIRLKAKENKTLVGTQRRWKLFSFFRRTVGITTSISQQQRRRAQKENKSHVVTYLYYENGEYCTKYKKNIRVLCGYIMQKKRIF